MKKLNRKGFTLIELLSIIVILGLISGITITIVLTTMANAKTKSKQITLDNIAGQAEEYIYEGFSNSNWTSTTNESGEKEEFKCIKVQNLVDAGYFKQDIITKNSDIISPDTWIKIVRDRLSKVIKSKTIANTDIKCDVTASNTPIISCAYKPSTGYATSKEVTITFDNSEGYTKRVSLSGINSPEPGNGFPNKPTDGYYMIASDVATVTVSEEGVIIAEAISDENQTTRTYCNVTGFDNTPPAVSLEIYSCKNGLYGKCLRCKMQDTESGLNQYKICKQGDNSCQYNSIGGIENSHDQIIRTKESDLSVGDWRCYAKDNNGNEGESETINIPKEEDTVSVSYGLSAYRIDSSGNETGYSGNWTNQSIKLKGTITTNTTTWYVLTDSGTVNNDDWIKYNDGDDISLELTENNIVIDKTYYLHVKYLEKGKYNTGYDNKAVKIDKKPPTVILEVENTNNLKCTITDEGSGVKVYKLCKKGDEHCNGEELTGYLTYNGSPATLNNVEDGTYYCYGKDKLGNPGQASPVDVLNTPAAAVSVNFKAEELNDSGGVSGQHSGDNWTNKSVRLTGTITTNVDTWYKISDSKISNPAGATGWTKCTSSNCVATENLTQSNVIINKTYYLYVKYTGTNGTEYKELSQKVKIDKKAPTCDIQITSNDQSDGIDATIACKDQSDGSGCQTSSSAYTDQITNITKTIKDKAGNSKACKINVTLNAKKKYCQEDHYNERCMTYDNYNDSGNLVTWYTSPTNSQLESRVTCASGYSTKNGAKDQFRYYIRQERNNWKTSSQEGSKYNLKKSEIKLCYSTKKATWEKIEHTQGSDNGKYFWYAKNIGSGSGDSPLARAIKGLVVCGERPSSSSYPNLASFGFTTRYSSVSTSNFPSNTDRIKHKGYSCQYEEKSSSDACPSGVAELNKLVIPTTGGGYYIEENNAEADSGPNNWNGEKWFTCVGKYHGEIG